MEKLTAQQRAQLFQLSTRQNMQMMAKKSTSQPNSTLEFQLPKARLLSNIFLRFKASIKVTHASATELAMGGLTPFKLIQQIKLDLNNGFAPYTISGAGLAMMNHLNKNAQMVAQKTSAYNNNGGKLTASATGVDNDVIFTLQLPVTLNDRDPVGLLLLQSEQTIADLRVSIGSCTDMFTAAESSGFTIALNAIEVEPCLETFSIPANSEAFPDLSILKLVQDRADSITSTGQNIVKLSTGTIYRKIVLYMTDANGAPITPADLSGTIDLVFNQADTNYAISADMIRSINAYKIGADLPEGMYVFDFSDCSYGTGRDYIDTEKLTEFWLRFNSAKLGKVRIVTECLSRLV